jgi:hypothetical protein
MDTKARYIYCHNMKENGVGGEIWRQIRVITKLPNSEQSYKGSVVYNCSNMEKYRVNKIHVGRGESDMNFIDPIFFRIRTIVHCVTNLS